MFGNVNMAAFILKRSVVSSKHEALGRKNYIYFPIYSVRLRVFSLSARLIFVFSHGYHLRHARLTERKRD